MLSASTDYATVGPADVKRDGGAGLSGGAGLNRAAVERVSRCDHVRINCVTRLSIGRPLAAERDWGVLAEAAGDFGRSCAWPLSRAMCEAIRTRQRAGLSGARDYLISVSPAR